MAAAFTAANTNLQPAVDPGLGAALDKLAVIMDRTSRGKANKPKFDDTHRSYPKFRESLLSYVKDHCSGLSNVTIVHDVPECFTEETKNRIAHCCSVESILERLDQTYRRPEFFIESVLDSIRNFGQIADYKTELLESTMTISCRS